MTYILSCQKCHLPFDAATALWCGCPSGTASLVCEKCGACFCNALASYRRKAWTEAPRDLRESPHRFRMQTHPPSRDADVPSAGRRPVVLIVDDDEAMRAFAACVIESLGYRVILCDDPHKGLDMAGADYVDVILTDALMPKMDGREMCRLIKQWHPQKKVIVMTSLYRGRIYRAEALARFGADEYLTKPLDLEKLAKVLAALTETHNAANVAVPSPAMAAKSSA